MTDAIQIAPEVIEQIRANAHLQNSIYRNLDIEGTLDFFTRRYVQPLRRWFDLRNTVAVDCGAGYGWFAMAYLLGGGLRVVAADPDQTRLRSAEEIAQILGVADRMTFIVSTVEALPLATDEADLFVCIETLEHVGQQNIARALQTIKRIAAQGLLITTPNKLFPAIAHDTRLPFAHWLPSAVRQSYAELFGRRHMNANNAFVSPTDLALLRDKFHPVSSCLTFATFEEYMNHFPHYLPYGRNESNRIQRRPSSAKAIYYQWASKLLGVYAYWAMPSLATIFARNGRA
jgi:ubiquinone/menaquinone biosynthesis C-methylase UbiE